MGEPMTWPAAIVFVVLALAPVFIIVAVVLSERNK